MAKEQILLEYQLVQKGGEKVVSTVTDITEAWDKSGKAATAALSEKQIDNATAKLTKFNTEVEKTAAGFTSAKSELRELEKVITSGNLQGNDLKTAVKRAAELKDKIGDVRSEIGRLSSDTRIFDTFVEGGRAVAAAFSVAQGAAALFGDENKDLQKSILKVQGALALLTGAQELANIVTKQGGIATQAYGVALKVVDGIAKVTGLSVAASMAVATAGVTLVLAGIAYLITSLQSESDVTEEATKHTNEFADSLNRTSNEAAALQIELDKSKGRITEFDAQIKKSALDYKVAREEVIATETKLLEDLRKKQLESTDPGALQKLFEEEKKIKEDSRQALAAIDEKFDLQITKQFQDNENKKSEIAKKEQEKRKAEADKNAALNLANDQQIVIEQSKLAADRISQLDKEIAEAKARNDAARVAELQARKDADAKQIEQANEFAAQEIERLEKLNAQKKALTEAFFSFASSAASSLSTIATSAFTQESQTLQAEKDRQLQTVGDNTKAREAIEKRFAIKSAEIKRKQAIADKVFAVANIGINLAQAIMKQLSVTPLPAGAAFIGLLVATAGLQLAAVLSTPLPEIPKFKKGVIGFKGKGTQTSDENLVMISNNESVMTGKATQKYNEELQAAQDLQLEDLIYHKYLLPALKQAGAADKDGNLYDDWMLRREVKASRQADRENSKYIVSGILSGMREHSYNSRKHYVNN